MTERNDQSEAPGYTYRADWWCDSCIEDLVDRSELVDCSNCCGLTTPDDPWARKTLRGRCVTDNHALPFDRDQVESLYPKHCNVCHVRLATVYSLEWIVGDEGIDAELTPLYRLVDWEIPLEDPFAFDDGVRQHGLCYVAWVRNNHGRSVTVADYEQAIAGMDPSEVLAAGEHLRGLLLHA